MLHVGMRWIMLGMLEGGPLSTYLRLSVLLLFLQQSVCPCLSPDVSSGLQHWLLCVYPAARIRAEQRGRAVCRYVQICREAGWGEVTLVLSAVVVPTGDSAGRQQRRRYREGCLWRLDQVPQPLGARPREVPGRWR